MTWQAALTEAMAAGQARAAAEIALREVVAEQRRALAGEAPALTVTGALDGGDIVFGIEGPAGRWNVRRSLSDLADRAAANPDVAVSLLGAVAASAIGRDRWGEEEWLPYGYIGAGSPPQPHGRDFLQTERDVRLNAALELGDVLLIGRPASGKSASAAEAAIVREVNHGDGIVWLDLTDPYDNAETVMLSLLRSPRRAGFLLVVDNLQANASAPAEILQLVLRLRAEIGLSVRVLATCWSSAIALIDGLPLRFAKIAADGREVLRRMLADVPDAEAHSADFHRLASGDLVLAKTALEHFRRVREVPTPQQLAAAVAARLKADRLTDAKARRALYWFACLGVFEIGVYRKYSAAMHPDWPVDDLRRRGLIRLVDEMYTVGHPSTAAALVRFAGEHWDTPDQPFEKASRLAFEYLRRAGRAAVQATLEKLDLVNHGHAPHGGGDMLARVWPHRGVLAHYLRDQALRRDRSWNGSSGSAAFAAVALALLDQKDAWEVTAEYVRGQWGYAAELPTFVGAVPSADEADFRMIEQAMRVEDGSARASERHAQQGVDSLDFDRFYRTWMLGILLTFENTAVGDKSRGQALTAIAAKNQLHTGAFYPERVPWITARVLNGLRHGNLTLDTDTRSRMVERACKWLCRSAEDDGPFNGRWHSGTGSWNTDVMTTAMCITALMRAGIEPTDSCVRAGYEYLKREMPNWRRPGREIDCAAAAEAMLLVGPDRQEIYPVVVDLLQWVGRGEAPSDPGGEESAKIPYVAEQVVWIVQHIVEHELEALLQDFAEPAAAAAAPAAASRVPGSGGAARRPPVRVNGAPRDPAAAERHRLALERLARIRREVEANIASRENALRGRGPEGVRTIQDQLDLWTRRGRRYADLDAQAQAAPVGEELAARIAELFTEAVAAPE